MDGYTDYQHDYLDEDRLRLLDEPDTCKRNKDKIFMLYMSIPAILFLLIASLIKANQHLSLGNCFKMNLWRRPAIIYPIDFGDLKNRNWAYIAVVLSLAKRILDVFPTGHVHRFKNFDDPSWMNKFSWTIVLYRLCCIFWLCLLFTPLMVLIGLRRNIVCNVLGILYLLPWIAELMWFFVECDQFSASGGIPVWYNTMMFLCDIPLYIALAAVLISFIWDLYTNIYEKRGQTVDNPVLKLYRKMKGYGEVQNNNQTESGHFVYVRNLLKKKSEEQPPAGIKERIVRRLKYESVPGFRYSRRVLFTMGVAALFLFTSCYKIALEFNYVFLYLRDLAGKTEPWLAENGHSSSEIFEYITILHGSANASVILSLFLHVGLMAHMVLCYRKNMLRMQKGAYQHKFMGSPSAALVSSMKYAGYQIAFLVYGWAIMFLVWFTFFLCLTFLIILPLRDGKPIMWFLNKLKYQWPVFLIIVGIYVCQLLAAKYAFLQGRGMYLALKNRPVYFLVDFVLFFFNILLGFVSCIKRIIFSTIFGTILISRLDRPLLMRGYERFDTGFKAYLGMMRLDLAQNHPVLRTFVDILSQNKSSDVEEDEEASEIRVDDDFVHINKDDILRKRRARLRWFKAYTLIRNEILKLEHSRWKSQECATRVLSKSVFDVILDSVVTAGAAVVQVGTDGGKMALLS